MHGEKKYRIGDGLELERTFRLIYIVFSIQKNPILEFYIVLSKIVKKKCLRRVFIHALN